MYRGEYSEESKLKIILRETGKCLLKNAERCDIVCRWGREVRMGDKANENQPCGPLRLRGAVDFKWTTCVKYF